MANQCTTLEELYTWCLQQHYKTNDHHPNYFRDPEKEMTLIAKMELTCDLLACVLGVYRKKKIPVSLSECVFAVEIEKWDDWRYAIKTFLPVPSDIACNRGDQWIYFPEEERTRLKELFENYKNGACLKSIRGNLEKLNSVQYYLEDLRYHKNAVREIWSQIPEFNIPGMRYRIKHHDNDKNDTIMILGYTANWCFKK